MLAPHLVEVKELPISKLCTYIDNKHYQPIEQLFHNIEDCLYELQSSSDEIGKAEMVSVLFYRIKDELQQLIRNDKIIIFPLVQRLQGEAPEMKGKVPVQMVHAMNKKIMTLLDRLRHIVNDYIAKPDWSQTFRIFCDELHNLEQHALQAIYLKENVLLPRVVKELD